MTSTGPPPDEPGRQWVVTNEFATVLLSLEERRGDTVLVLRETNSGAEAVVGALELEILARSSLDERLDFYRQVMRMVPERLPEEAEDLPS